MRDFLSRYFRSGKKLSWLNDVCLVSFQLRGGDRELILYSSKGRVPRIDISSFPWQRELDLDWREVLGKNRELETPFQTPQKKVRSDDCVTLSPLIKEGSLCSNCHCEQIVATHWATILRSSYNPTQLLLQSQTKSKFIIIRSKLWRFLRSNLVNLTSIPNQSPLDYH